LFGGELIDSVTNIGQPMSLLVKLDRIALEVTTTAVIPSPTGNRRYVDVQLLLAAEGAKCCCGQMLLDRDFYGL